LPPFAIDLHLSNDFRDFFMIILFCELFVEDTETCVVYGVAKKAIFAAFGVLAERTICIINALKTDAWSF